MADNWQLKAVISANAESMLKALKTVNSATRDTRKYLADVATASGKLSGRLGLPFAAISAALGGLSVMSVKNAVVGFTEMGDAVQKGALKAGMSVEQYQRMRYVAEQSGTSIDAMEISLSKLNRAAGEAAVGKNKDVASLMSHLGINVRDANGNVRTGIDLLPELADAFKRNESPVARARMGMALFGKSYSEILPLLAEGSQGISDNLQRFDKIKGVLSASDIRAAKDLGDSFKDLDLVMKGFQGTVAKELLPVIKPLVDDLVAWWVANKKLVGSEINKMAKELAAYIKTIDFKAVLQGVGDFFSGLGRLVEMVGGAKNALIGFVIFMNLQTILALGGVAMAVGKVIWSLGVMTLSAIPQATVALGGLNAAMAGASTVGLGLLGILGKVAAAGAVGYGIGTLLNKYVIDPAAQLMSGNKDATLGTALYDLFHGDEVNPSSGGKSSLVTAGSQVKAAGQIEVSFKDAPPGMRVEQTKVGGDIPLNLDVGYRSYAMGMPL